MQLGGSITRGIAWPLSMNTKVTRDESRTVPPLFAPTCSPPKMSWGHQNARRKFPREVGVELLV